jgi:hypothetical protein
MKTPRFASWRPLLGVTQPSLGFQVSGVGEVIWELRLCMLGGVGDESCVTFYYQPMLGTS